MTFVLLQIASGNVFFVGLGLSFVAIAGKTRWKGRLSNSLFRIAWLLGAILVALSATPLPLWSYTIWLACGIIAVITNRLPTFALFAIVTLSMAALEIPYRLAPSISIAPDQPIFVVGDSLSAGIRKTGDNWPTALERLSGMPVTNLAVPGATAEAAQRQAAKVHGPHPLVFVEIGGNNLLSGQKGDDFSQELDPLLETLKEADAHVVFFETPLLPLRNDFGAVQRTLIRKYNASLVPKRFLTSVLGTEGAVSDGLHLTPQGDEALAKEVFGLLNIPKR